MSFRTPPLCEQVIQEVSSDESTETIERKRRSPTSSGNGRTPKGEKTKEQQQQQQQSNGFSSESDYFAESSDVTIPSSDDWENRHKSNVNSQIAALMSTSSPLPSFAPTESPIGRLEMDMDDLTSLQKFVYYSDGEMSPPEEARSTNTTPQTFLLAPRGGAQDNLQNWTPSNTADKTKQINQFTMTIPEFKNGSVSPMVGDR